ncbi:MAG: glycosyltransferase [Clostridiales bacterium]|jgi:rhamnosyl/mannosyltransferase|nr:glycosyltransferase [Clostridiales bacterium]
MKKLKILQVNKLYPPVIGGIEQVVRQIAEGLAAETDMKVLVCKQKGKGCVEKINGVEIHRAGSVGVAFSLPLSLQFFFWFRKLSKDSDVLHIHMPFPLADLAALMFKYNGRVVLWWHSDIVRQKYFMWLYRPLMMRALKRADIILTATEGHITGSEFLPMFRDKCVVVPFGVKPPSIPPKTDKLGNNDKVITFLSVGRLIYYKGYDILLKALSYVPYAKLVIIGCGPLKKALYKQAENLKITDRVVFRGEVSDDELGEAFNQCDVFVLPSVAKSEAFGLVQIEAMARGKPVINTKLNSGVPYVSLNGVTGLTVPPGDVNALASAMNLLAGDADLREKYGQAAFARVLDKFSLHNMLEGVMKVYRGEAFENNRRNHGRW